MSESLAYLADRAAMFAFAGAIVTFIVMGIRYVRALYAAKSATLDKPRVLPRFSFGVGIFVTLLLACFAFSGLVVFHARGVVARALEPTANPRLLIDGEIVQDQERMLAAMRTIKNSLGHHSHATRRFRVQIDSTGESLQLELGQDSEQSDEYWVFLPRYWVTSTLETGRLSSDVFSRKPAQAETASMRPSLVALQVGDLDASVGWYIKYLDFQQKVRREFPEHQLRLAILNFGDFDLELVENSKSLKRTELLAGRDTEITGFAKVTFTVGDVGKLFQELRDEGATFAITLRDSNTKPDEQFFVVLDNEKNWLQFVGKRLAKREN